MGKWKEDIRERLMLRIGMRDIHEITCRIQDNDEKKQELYDLLFDHQEKVAYHAAWVLTHLSSAENKWLYGKQNDLIDEVIVCAHDGKRRLLLNLLYRQPLAESLRVDFLDFCLERMMSRTELPGVKTLCIKLAYEMCRPIPELLQEFQAMLDIMEPSLLVPSIRAVRKNILKAMKTKKSLQTY